MDVEDTQAALLEAIHDGIRAYVQTPSSTAAKEMAESVEALANAYFLIAEDDD
jgi:hypothetical protein